MESYQLDVIRNVLGTWGFFLVLFTILCALTIIAVRMHKYPLNMTEERCNVHLEKPGWYVLNPHKGSQIEMLKFQVPQEMKNFAETKNDGVRRRNVESSNSENEMRAKNDDVTRSNLEVIYRGVTFSNSDCEVRTNDEVTINNFELSRVTESRSSDIIIRKKNDGVKRMNVDSSNSENEMRAKNDDVTRSNLEVIYKGVTFSNSDCEVIKNDDEVTIRNFDLSRVSESRNSDSVCDDDDESIRNLESHSDIEVRNTVVESTNDIEVRLRKGEGDMESAEPMEFDHYIVLERPGKYAISGDPGYTLATVKFQLPSDCRIWSPEKLMSCNNEETNINDIDIKKLDCHITLFVPGKYVLNIQRGSEHSLVYITVPQVIKMTEDENYEIVRMNYDVKTCERSVKTRSRSLLIWTGSMGIKKEGRIRSIAMRSRKIPNTGKQIKNSARLLLR